MKQSITHILFICLNLNYIQSIGQQQLAGERHFLYKSNINTSKGNYETHIVVKQILFPTKDNMIISNDIDDRDIISRSRYTREDEINILGEYLTFRGDTSTSNKKYIFKAASHMIRPENTMGFTVQIEALYSFTRMLTQGLPPIKPTLINRYTMEPLNNNPKAVNEIYDIYNKWFVKNKKNNFKSIKLPLDGSPYCWFGENKGMESFVKTCL